MSGMASLWTGKEGIRTSYEQSPQIKAQAEACQCEKEAEGQMREGGEVDTREDKEPSSHFWGTRGVH